MNIEDYRSFCLQFKGVTEEFPFDQNTLVFKVKGKMFVAFGVDSFNRINLKCDPELALELREQYEGIKPGYHMSKKHWNSVYVESDVPDNKLRELTKHSYELVVNSLTKKLKLELQEE